MNDDFFAAARRFGEASRVLNPFDLGIALFLEYFAMPVLLFGTYVPLRRRQLVPDLSVEFRDWISTHLPADRIPDWEALTTWAQTAIEGPAKQQEFLEVVGQSVHRRLLLRRREIRRANVISELVLTVAILVHVISLVAMIVTTGWLFPLWLITLLYTTVICRHDLHWKPKDPPESV